MNKIYVITYHIKDEKGVVLKGGVIKVKNKKNLLSAKISLETYLKNKHPKMSSLFITNHYEENDVSSIFNTLFGNNKSNPFNF